MIRSFTVCAVLLAARLAFGQYAAPAALPAAPPRQQPQPLRDRVVQPASTEAQSPTKLAEDRARLEQKLAERDRLQREIDRLRLAAGLPQQILVRIQVIEVNASRMRELGIEFATVDDTNPLVPKPPSTFEIYTPDGDRAMDFIHMLQKNNIAKILAEPSIVVLSGRPASFHVGDEIPVPARPGTDAAIEFQKVGTQVDVVATNIGDNRVRMELRASVSEADYDHTVEVAGMKTPAIRRRQCDTALELALGQSGLLSGFTEQRIEALVSETGTVNQPVDIQLLFVVTPEAVQ